MFHQREQDICVLCSIERHLEKIKRKAIKAGYQGNTMIVSGVESLIKMKLCDDCLIPYKDQACDCWLQEIGEDIFSK